MSGEIETISRVIREAFHCKMSLPHFLYIVKNFTCSAFEKYHLTKKLILCISFVLIVSKKFQISAECSK